MIQNTNKELKNPVLEPELFFLLMPGLEKTLFLK